MYIKTELHIVKCKLHDILLYISSGMDLHFFIILSTCTWRFSNSSYLVVNIVEISHQHDSSNFEKIPQLSYVCQVRTIEHPMNASYCLSLLLAL